MERYAFLASLIIVSLASPAVAQEDAEAPEENKQGAKSTENEATEDALVAVPDRPTFSAAAATVPAGHAQLEAGVDVASADETSLAIPIVARLGLADSFELSAGLPAVVIPFSDAPTELGSLRIAGKVAGNVSDVLSLGAMPFYDIPSSVGEETVFSQSTYGAMGLIGANIGGDFGLFSNVGVSVGPSTNETNPREVFYAASAGAGWTITDGFGVSVEGFGVFGQFADPDLGGDLSVSYAILDNLVVDAYFATSAQGESTTFTGGAGVTYLR